MGDLTMWFILIFIAAFEGISLSKNLAGKFSMIDCLTERCQINETSLRFIAFGDWGGVETRPWVTEQQLKMAKFLAVTAEKTNTHMIITTGDNFYRTGVHSAKDFRFKKTFEEVYVDESLKYVPWYVVAGNHDHYGNVSGQIAYTKESLLKRWKFPDFYYTAKYEILGGTKIDFVFLDTVILCGNTAWDSDLRKSVLRTGDDDDQPSEPPNPIPSQAEWEWTERQLNKSK